MWILSQSKSVEAEKGLGENPETPALQCQLRGRGDRKENEEENS